MSRKWLIVLILVAVAVALMLLKANQPWPDIAQQLRGEVQKNELYVSEKYSVSFEYPRSYFLEEKDTSTSQLYSHHVSLTEDTEENRQFRGNATSTIPREKPVAITFDFYQNYPSRQSVGQWIKGSTLSGYKLSQDLVLASTTVAGKDALRYHWSGLYEAESVVFSHNGYVVLATVTYLTPNDPIISDFHSILSSLKLSSLSEAEAISVVKGRFPDLKNYPGDSLPPTSILATRQNDGWGLVFAQNGSGLPGILKARCFTVSDERQLTSTGTFSRSGDQTIDKLNPLTCKP